MLGVLGWTSARGRPDWGTLVLFAILFFWQFPHFSRLRGYIEKTMPRGDIRMLPVIEEKGRSTGFANPYIFTAAGPRQPNAKLAGHGGKGLSD